MRLLLSICLMLASVVAGRAQALTWSAPSSPMHGEARHDGYASATADVAVEERGKPSDATVFGDDTAAGSVSVSRERLLRVAPEAGPDIWSSDDALPSDDRRAIRLFRRALALPDVA